ncbi:MAG: MOSC domain-containing protein [Bryobacteraceae bacterium]
MNTSLSNVMWLSRIFIYPIKSLRGIAVSESQVDTSGPLQDRRWMLVDEQGVFLSQRKLPRMVLIQPHFDGSDLVVTATGTSPLLIRKWSGKGEWIPVQIWRDSLKLPHPDQSYDEWFSSFLGQPCRLLYLPNDVVRKVEPPFDDSKWRVSLADGYPLLVLAQASLDLLNARLSSRISVEHFRPNLVLADTAAHAEDGLNDIRIGSVELTMVKPCARCSVVLVDPTTAKVGVEPLRTLEAYRRMSNGVMFGQNALVVTPGQLRVGNSVEILNARG